MAVPQSRGNELEWVNDVQDTCGNFVLAIPFLVNRPIYGPPLLKHVFYLSVAKKKSQQGKRVNFVWLYNGLYSAAG